MKKKLALFCSIAAISQGVKAYDPDGHFYAPYMMAVDVNGGKALPDDLLTIVRTIQYVDDHPKTLPSFSPTEAESRRTFHFAGAVETFGYGTVKRNSAFAKHNVNRALQENDPYWLGMALHTYLDSYAHEGYEALVGQARNGYDADRPHKNVDGFKQMSRYLYSILEKWQSNNSRPTGLGKLTTEQYGQWAGFVPDGHKCAGVGALNLVDCYGYQYTTWEVAPRIANWKAQMDVQFPGLYRVYELLSGQSKTDFEARIAGYLMPKQAADAIATEWENKKATVNSSSGQTASIKAMPVFEEPASLDKLARLILQEPKRFPDGLPARLQTRKGVKALLRQASKMRDGWFNLSLVDSYGDGSNVDWQDYVKDIKGNLKSNNLQKRLFALSVLSRPVNADDPSICGRADKIFSAANPTKLTENQRFLLLKAIVPDGFWITHCAPTSVRVVHALLADSRLGGMAAARMYQIISDQSSDLDHPNDPVAVEKMRAMRDEVSDDLWESIQLNGVNASLSQSIQQEQKYWSLRGRADNDDGLSHSPHDQAHLAQLTSLLSDAWRKNDHEIIQGISIAIATYDANDKPASELLQLLESMLSDPKLVDIRIELGYALEQLTGKVMPLSSYWGESN